MFQLVVVILAAVALAAEEDIAPGKTLLKSIVSEDLLLKEQ